ncbi:MAG: energy transducer TonB [Bacteroidota bacterium]
MADHHNKKRFLNMPKYPGGSEAFREFISANLQYPQAALDANVGGTVIVEYDIPDNGIVQNPRVLKGIGYGCNEEALRVVGLLRFEKVKNRGVRVKMTTKTNINFILPGIKLNYSVSAEADPQTQKNEPGQQNAAPVVYEYTVTL